MSWRILASLPSEDLTILGNDDTGWLAYRIGTVEQIINKEIIDAVKQCTFIKIWNKDFSSITFMKIVGKAIQAFDQDPVYPTLNEVINSKVKNIFPKFKSKPSIDKPFSPSFFFAHLKTLHAKKDKKYGNQGVLLRNVMDLIQERLKLNLDNAKLGDFHFDMELMAKLLRFFNIRYGLPVTGSKECYTDLIECLRDIGVYAGMIASNLSLDREKCRDGDSD